MSITLWSLQEAEQYSLEEGMVDGAGNSIAPGTLVAYNNGGGMSLGTVETVTLANKHIPIRWKSVWEPQNRNFKSATVRNKYTGTVTHVRKWWSIFAVKEND